MRSNLHKHLGWGSVQSSTSKYQVKIKEKCGKSNKFVPPKNSNMDFIRLQSSNTKNIRNSADPFGILL